MSYNPVKNVDFNSLPNYAIANVPILTYALLGITTLTLGYITIKDKEAEKGTAETATAPPTEPSAPVAPVTAIPETPLEKGGKKRKQKHTKSNNKKTKKQKQK